MDQNKPPNSALKFIFFILILLGVITVFISGFILRTLLPQSSANLTPKVPILVPPISTNKKYLEDSVMFVVPDNPLVTFVATITRQEEIAGYTQETRISFFDGKDWKRSSQSQFVSDQAFVPNTVLKAWNQTIDSSRVLQESLSGESAIENHVVKFATGILNNEISMRSLPGYTKFMSNGEGTLTLDGKTYKTYVLYTKIYSSDTSQIRVSYDNLDITTHWLAFWDTEGNFYHIDLTHVGSPSPLYTSHQVGIAEDKTRSVSKTFEVNVVTGSETPPNSYTLNLGSPLNHVLSLTLTDSFNKYPGLNFKWYLGHVKGTVIRNEGKQLSGIGVIEYVRD